MKSVFFAALLAISLFSCSKNDDGVEPLPEYPKPLPGEGMTYFDLKDVAITESGRSRVDLDADGSWDFAFSTIRIGDPLIQEDRVEHYIATNQGTYLLFNADDDVPAYSEGQEIPFTNLQGWNWFDIGYSRLISKHIRATPPATWKGAWKNITHRFIPVQRKKSEGILNGWIEVSADTENSRLILHRAAISTVPGRVVKAGE